MKNEAGIVIELALTTGNRIVVPKSMFGLIQHFAVYLGVDPRGHHFISENIIGKGVVLVRVKDFFEANPKNTRIEKFSGTTNQRMEITKKALKKVGAPYSLLAYNCEHYANEISLGKAHSRQINLVATLIGLLVLIGIVQE